MRPVDFPSEYRTWAGMKTRCLNRRSSQWENYGGRGIKVCKRWRESFANFMKDMGPRPSSNHSLDRVNNNGNYIKHNCRWATQAEQSRNTYRNVLITHNGETKTLSEWARVAGITPACLRDRYRTGWPFHRAISLPPDSRLPKGEKEVRFRYPAPRDWRRQNLKDRARMAAHYREMGMPEKLINREVGRQYPLRRPKNYFTAPLKNSNPTTPSNESNDD